LVSGVGIRLTPLTFLGPKPGHEIQAKKKKDQTRENKKFQKRGK